MESTIQELTDKITRRLDALESPSGQQNGSRVLVGICGVPASGKTSLALSVVDRVNSWYRSSRYANTDAADVAICVSQDGWHLPRSALDNFEDVKNAYDRRGAAFTFDGVAFSKFVASLRDGSRTTTIVDQPIVDDDEPRAPMNQGLEHLSTSSNENILYAPGFSHTLKDPTENAIAIYPHHNVIIIEGLYTFLGIEPWKAASLALDERWFVDVDPKVARERLVRRHVVTGVAGDLVEAEWRADNNDIPNGDFIRENMLQPTHTIYSLDDPVLASHGRTE